VLALPPVPPAVVVDLFDPQRRDDVEIVAAERTQDEVARLLPDVDVVLGDWSPSLRLLEPGPRVCFVQQPSVGVDGIDVDACTAAGVPVANCAGANTTSVAEWCVSATLALLRRTGEADAAVRAGSWPQTALGGRELAGSRVGVVGMGPVGRATAALFAAFRCDVVHWSRSRRDDAPAPWVEIDELLATSDVVVLVIALGPATRDLLDEAGLARLKPGALVVNAARGGVLDEDALARALEAGHVGGAAPRVLLSPHAAGSTVQAVTRILEQTNANLRRVLDGEPVVDVVNGLDPHVVRRRGRG
jgi:D-3-phosphoglycerate dehydrogenase